MTTYYLNADTGVDSGAGDAAHPWKTIVYAIAHSVALDTLYCQNSAATFDFRTATITNRNIIGQSVSGVVFDGANGFYRWSCTEVINITNIWFKNISLQTGTAWSTCIIGYTSTATITISNCRFNNCYGRVYGSDGGLIGSIGGPAIVANLTISTCIFDDPKIYIGTGNADLFAMKYAAAGSIFNFNNNVIIIRTASQQPLYLFAFPNGNVALTIKNSIFRNLQASIAIGDINTNLGIYTVYNSDFNGTFTDGVTVSKTSCITTDPLFVDENNGNFNLRPTSPCIDTGTII